MPQAVKKTPPKQVLPGGRQAIDISTITTPRLKSLMQEIEGELKKREKEDRKKAYSRMQEVVAEYGLTLEDVLGDRKKHSKKIHTPLSPKYINPDNPKQTWNERGPRPKWLKQLLESGRSLEELTLTSAQE